MLTGVIIYSIRESLIIPCWQSIIRDSLKNACYMRIVSTSLWLFSVCAE